MSTFVVVAKIDPWYFVVKLLLRVLWTSAWAGTCVARVGILIDELWAHHRHIGGVAS